MADVKVESKSKKPQNQINVVYKEEYQIIEFLKRITLEVRTRLDTNDTVILDARRSRSIGIAFDIALSKNLESLVSIKEIVASPMNVVVTDRKDKTKKRDSRISTVQIILQKIK